jgi:hypothetical protein
VRGSVIRGEIRYDGEADIVSRVRSAGERWRFGLEPEEVQPFLAARGFSFIELLDAKALGARYFANEGGRARVNDTHFIAIGRR